MVAYACHGGIRENRPHHIQKVLFNMCQLAGALVWRVQWEWQDFVLRLLWGLVTQVGMELFFNRYDEARVLGKAISGRD